MKRVGRGSAIGLVAMAALFSGCGNDAATNPANTTSSTTPTAISSSVTSSTKASSSTSTTMLDSAPMTPVIEGDLPGEAFELHPPAGRVLAVVGVAFDDGLDLRRMPGTDQDIVGVLAPTLEGIVATGRARLVASSIWWEVTDPGGVVGWVSARFTAQIGPTGDVTARVVERLGSIPTAPTMEELAALVADEMRGDPEGPTTITQTTPVSIGDLGEITFDLIGLGDDATHGLRLHVFGTPDQAVGFGLKSVESTDLCDAARGVSDGSGLCA